MAHSMKEKGKIDHTQILGVRIRVQVSLSPSQIYTVAYFKQSKNYNGKI